MDEGYVMRILYAGRLYNGWGLCDVYTIGLYNVREHICWLAALQNQVLYFSYTLHERGQSLSSGK